VQYIVEHTPELSAGVIVGVLVLFAIAAILIDNSRNRQAVPELVEPTPIHYEPTIADFTTRRQQNGDVMESDAS
jgi:hypothetical protein